MRGDLIIAILGAVGAKKISSNATRVRSSCPLAPWRHSSGKDDHPSFVVFIKDNDESVCKCMSAACGFKGTLTKLLWSIQSYSNSDIPDSIWQIILGNDKVDFIAAAEKLRDNGGIYSNTKDIPNAVDGGVDPDDFIKLIDKAGNIDHHEHYVIEMQRLLNDQSMNFLHNKRKLSDSAISRWKLGWHPKARRISIPQYDYSGKLVNIGGRYVDSEFDDPFWEPIPWMHATDFKKECFLFGENLFRSYDGNGTLVLVEGMFDAIYLDDHNVPNCAAMLGSHLSRYQAMKVIRWFNRLVIVPDGDPPGYAAADRIYNNWKQKIQIDIFKTPLDKDPDELTDAEINQLITLLG